jgi:DNA repair protein SbcD/Mre11
VNQREADVAAAFRACIDAVIAKAPDAIVIAGDLFHSVRPTNRSIIEAFTQLSRVRRELPGAPVLLIAGNHDTPRSAEVGSILKLVASLGVDVVDEKTRRLDYPGGLCVTAVPHAALAGEGRRDWHPYPNARYNILVMHPEIAEVFGGVAHAPHADLGGVRLQAVELRTHEWNYCALGHYHVRTEVAPRAWYAGSLEYTSPNIWSEWHEEEYRGLTKGFLIADLESGAVEAVPLPRLRVVHDLPKLDADGMTAAELDAAIQGRVAGVAGGIADTVTRLVVDNVPRSLAHGLDHAAIRALRARALHFHLDLRRPAPVTRTTGLGAPAVRRTMPELVADYLSRRPLDADLDRDAFITAGRRYIETVESDLADGAR